jgi:hypothetical protein
METDIDVRFSQSVKPTNSFHSSVYWSVTRNATETTCRASRFVRALNIGKHSVDGMRVIQD